MTKAIVVAGASAGVGKTTVAVGLAAALAKRGLKVQTFKVGPDGYDPTWLTAASGRPCVNLDLWMMPKRAVLEVYGRHASRADVCVIEGMMGLYDGMSMRGAAVSTADLNGLIGAPVVLVVDASLMAESAAAVVHGFATFGEVPLKGVVFNRVGEKHYARLRSAVEVAGDVEALGFLPPEEGLALPERPNGIVAAEEARAKELSRALGEKVEGCLDVDEILEIAGKAAEHKVAPPTKKGTLKPRARIAVARDAAFHFYYEENLAALRAAGAEIVPFSPLKEKELPFATSGLYLGGGFAEIHAETLDKNRALREAVRKAIEGGLPTYAECGGMMYLAKHFVGTGVRAWEMAGVLPGEVSMSRGASGYATAVAERETFLVKKGETLRGHEFRPATWSGEGGDESLYRVSRPGREDGRLEGLGRETLHASFVHLHFTSCPEVAKRFVDAAEAHAKTSGKKKGKKK
jgi:cobyrinic acid a,c-diamide synthase